ncbi:unnamed protein product [Linum tenue]|uniref:PHD-type domain-containing protein n=1 Tax=Linum tenue TaxID=586396 RepID=A0AAV0NLK0_9ROSI|nr:unnamed protein product [Linum tenue]
MELRLMHGIAYKAPWFGSWGYKFSRAIDTLRAMPLCILVHYLGSSNHDIPIIFSRYQMLSDHSLTTLGDMFQFMLELKTRMAEQSCRWSPKRIEMATRAIEVRDAARIYIGDTGLLDFVLKSLGNHMVGNYLVRRCLNPVTKLMVEVEKIFRDLYWGMKNLILDSVANLMMYYEGGSNWNKVVVCGCGAREDDGERMVSCDICEVWQHTKCVGIPHHQPTPQIFLCKRCENEIVTLPAFP